MAALPIVRRSVDAKLVVAGSFFEPFERYERQVRDLGVADAVRFLPDYIPDEQVPALFAASDVVALPYRSASQSGVLGQAALAGRPVVATRVGSLPQMSASAACSCRRRTPWRSPRASCARSPTRPRRRVSTRARGAPGATSSSTSPAGVRRCPLASAPAETAARLGLNPAKGPPEG